MRKCRVFILFVLITAIFTLAACDNGNIGDNGTDVYCTVKFVTNCDIAVDNQTVLKDSKIADPNLSRIGWTLDGWFTESAFTNEFDIQNTSVTKDMTLYAKWTQNLAPATTYKVTFNSNGGSSVTEQTVNEYETAILPTAPTKANHTFAGWFTDSGFSLSFSFATPIMQNITLYAKWTPNSVSETTTYTVTFVSNGGSTVQTQEVEENATATKPTNPTKGGHTFVNWYSDIGLTNEFNFATAITQNTTLYAKWTETAVPVTTYVVTFNSNGGSTVQEQVVEKNTTATEPVTPTKNGFIFLSWYSNVGLTTEFNFETAITQNITLYAKWLSTADEKISDFGSFNEALYAEWADGAPQNASAFYKAQGDADWTAVDQELIRKDSGSSGVSRVDVVGLKAGTYDLKVVSSSANEMLVSNITVEAHDRSGYAHFNYTAGIAAYKDDGTLKENAIVVYVTDANKDTITIDGVGQTGLGWILNNNQYSKSESNTYDPAAAATSLSSLNVPVVFRLIGKITPPAGLTVYDDLENGGSEGDNGFMARMKDCNNITIEGIGDDAIIEGWGIHFMAATAGQGKGFEVSNLTFDKYPEDAIGMEGVQSGGKLTAPVERCWIHNVTFKPGFCAKPTENDKANGDGSCDFKRGNYYTVSYSHFDGAHKTNLIGASDDNLQYHITFHHNRWTNCASRIPLARMSNIHMYNNFFEITDDCKNEPSYMQNTRANAYIYSEFNYFHAGKYASRVDGGAIKSFGDVKYSCFNGDEATTVTNRETAVSTSNLYPNFDTNASLFYYDSVAKKSNVEHLTDAVTARAECIAYSGANRKTEFNLDTAKIYNGTITNINESVNVTTSTKIQKGQPLLAFRIATTAEFTMTSTASVNAVVVDIYGRMMLSGSGSVQLNPGIYVLESAQAHGASKGTSQAKEATVGSYSITLDSGEAKQARIQAAVDAFNNIPSEIAYNQDCRALITAAREAYNALLDDSERANVNLADLTTAETAYINSGITYVKGLINAIGTVTEDSYAAIDAARQAYDNAMTEIKNGVNNYEILAQAEADFDNFAVINVINLINDLTDAESVDFEIRVEVENALSEYNTAKAAYDKLDGSKKSEITNYSKLSNGLTKLNEVYTVYKIMDTLDLVDLGDITLSNSSDLIWAYQSYNSLDVEIQALLPSECLTKLNSAWEIYSELANQTITHNFTTQGVTSDFFKFTGDSLATNKGTMTVKGETLTHAMKTNSKFMLEFTTTTEMTLTFYVLNWSGAVLTVDGVNHNVTGEVFTVTISAGDHTIVRKSVEMALFYIELSPAA